MPQINDVLSSAVTVIVRYNVVKLGITPSREAETVAALLKKTRAEMIGDLTALISASTASDPTRTPLLTYILYNIDKLREYTDRESPLEPTELESLKRSWIEVTANIQTLLKASQADQVKIVYDGKEVMLFGLVQRAWRLWNYCQSGTILAEVLLPSLGLVPDSTAENVSKTFTYKQTSLSI